MVPEYHLLVIEDNEGLLEVLTDRLLKEGYKVSSATDGQQGLATALTEHPDLILLDVMIPTMDGVTVIQQLRADEWGKAVPVIVLTNVSVNDKRVDDIIAELPAFYLVKTDLSMQALVDKIKERLERV